MKYQHPISSQIGANNDEARKTISEHGFLHGAIMHDLANDFNDQLADAEQFKNKGDTFYQNKKYEQAFKVYEIAHDLIKDYCQDNENKLR